MQRAADPRLPEPARLPADLYQQPGIAKTVNFDHIKHHYDMTHDAINPTRLVPVGPILDLDLPHGREKLRE